MNKKKPQRYSTVKKRKLLRIFSENLGKSGFTKTMRQMMLEAGYSESSANQQTTLLVGLKDELDTVVQKMESERQKALKRLKNRIGEAKYRDLIDAIDKLTKNIQLLRGGSTDWHTFSLSKLLDESDRNE